LARDFDEGNFDQGLPEQPAHHVSEERAGSATSASVAPAATTTAIVADMARVG
jgi:hypothetical protein